MGTLDKSFTQLLMKWHLTLNKRSMPWKGIKNPYKIWLSEIILQQTRVEQGTKYYEAFITKYPTIQDLAAANEEEVFKLWEGLGYYSRCRNLLFTAKYVVTYFNGKMPSNYEQLLTLKGVGDYTASAIASLAYNLPYAVVDGNVIRVLARVFGLELNAMSAIGKKEFSAKAYTLLDKKNPALYNQAIMDFGATVCTPKLPKCSQCIFNKNCVALLENKIDAYPFKKTKLAIKVRHFHYIIIEENQQLLVRKRTENDIWKDLHEFLLIEKESEILTKTDLSTFSFLPLRLAEPIILSQVLSHQKIIGYFYRIPLLKLKINTPENYFLINSSSINQLAFPKIITSFLNIYGEENI